MKSILSGKIVRKSKKQQAQDAELGLIIDEMGRAMWSANRGYIGQSGHFTANIAGAWTKYVEFCRTHPA